MLLVISPVASKELETLLVFTNYIHIPVSIFLMEILALLQCMGERKSGSPGYPQGSGKDVASYFSPFFICKLGVLKHTYRDIEEMQ